jgi:serine/threonine protein phosphatase PrpC
VSNPDPEIEVAVLSEKGRREENQDWMSWSRVSWGELFIVADGMGGHKGGALAARMTVEGLEKHLRDQPAEWPWVKAFQEAARKTNEEVYRSAHSGNPDTEKMGSTVVAALISNGRAQVGHIGDSRAYLFRNGKLRLLTKDHTIVQRMLDAGMITEDEARTHPEAHILNRAVGSKPEVEIEMSEPVKLEKGDGLMLCSDGLSGYVADPRIEKLLRSQSDVQRIPHALVDLALNSSGDDNITVQFIRYSEPVTDMVPVTLPPTEPVGRITAPQPAALRPPPPPSIRERLWQIFKKPVWQTVAVAVAISLLHLPEPPPAPRISLQASSATIRPGQATELTWEARNANQVRIEPGIGEVPASGSRKLAPTESVSFVATATGARRTVTARVDVVVEPEPAPPAAAPTVALVAKPERIKSGQAVSLGWNAQNADQVVIEPGIGGVDATGFRTVNPTESVSYVVTAKGPGGTASAKADIVVETPPTPASSAVAPTVALVAKPEKVKPGEPVELEWKAENAEEVRIEPEIGEVATTGSRKVTPTKSVSYVATAKGPGGTASAKFDIVVEPVAGPPTVALVAKPAKIKAGQPAQLEWKSQNASQVRIEPEIGEVATTGSRKVTPAKSVSYVATAKGPGGTASAKVDIVVEPVAGPPTVALVAKPAKIKAGQPAQLEWKSQNASQVRIEPEIGDVSPTGSQKVTPAKSVSYVATAKGPGGTASAKVDIVVEPEPAPPTVELAAKPDKIKSGETVQLEWKSQNASQVRIEPGIGEVPTTGSRTVTPTVSVSYVLTATGPGGTASAKVDIVVEPDR